MAILSTRNNKDDNNSGGLFRKLTDTICGAKCGRVERKKNHTTNDYISINLVDIQGDFIGDREIGSNKEYHRFSSVDWNNEWCDRTSRRRRARFTIGELVFDFESTVTSGG